LAKATAGFSPGGGILKAGRGVEPRLFETITGVTRRPEGLGESKLEPSAETFGTFCVR